MAALTDSSKGSSPINSDTDRRSSQTSDTSPESSVCLRRQKKLTQKRHMTREAFIRALHEQIIWIPSPQLERLGLQPHFYDFYNPKDGLEFVCKPSLLEIAARNRTLALVVDTLALLVCGSTSQKDEFLDLARRKYTSAVYSLRRELDMLTTVAEPFHFMTVVHILQVCELFDCIAQQPSEWQRHMKGMKAIMNAVSMNQRRRGAEQAGWVLSKTVKVPFGLWNGLLDHGGRAYEHSPSQSEVEQLRGSSPLDRLHYYGQVPIALQHGDFVCRLRKISTSDVAEAITRLIAAEGALHQAFADMYGSTNFLVYRTVAATKLSKSYIIANTDSATFAHAYVFLEIFTAMQHLYYWMCLLELRSMHLNIRAAAGKQAYPFEFDFCGFDHETLLWSTNECVDNICMCLAYITLPKRGLLGLMCSMAPIQVAARWYRKSNDLKKLEWCQKAADALAGRGLIRMEV